MSQSFIGMTLTVLSLSILGGVDPLLSSLDRYWTPATKRRLLIALSLLILLVPAFLWA